MLEAATYQIDEQSHFALWKLIFNRYWRTRLYWFGAIVVLAVAVASISKSITLEHIMPIIVGLAAGSFVVGLNRLLLRRRALRVFNESASLKEVQTFSIVADGFKINQKSGNWKQRWMDVTKWDETNQIFAIFPNRMMAYILPKSQVSKELIDFIRQAMVETGLSRPGKSRK